MKSLKRWILIGIITINFLGFCLHFLFSWTDGSKIIGLIAPVNESVWEHLKLGYWSVALFSIVEYLLLKQKFNNYYLAKTTGVLSLEIVIVLIYYGYTFLLRKDILWMDILSFILGVIVCQFLTFMIFKMKPYSKFINRICGIIFIAVGVLFGVFTFYPPNLAVFKDPNNNTYGIKKDK